MSMDASTLLDLAGRVDRLRGFTNAIDVEVEIALFEPCAEFASIRANDSGTKVILTSPGGAPRTFWARDWTIGPTQRVATAAALRARAAQIAASTAGQGQA